jgi:hypothetical protein
MLLWQVVCCASEGRVTFDSIIQWRRKDYAVTFTVLSIDTAYQHRTLPAQPEVSSTYVLRCLSRVNRPFDLFSSICIFSQWPN